MSKRGLNLVYNNSLRMSKGTLIYCTNCGEYGHTTKLCNLPITSFGTILFRVKGGWNQAQSLIQSDSVINGLEDPKQIEYLLIQRRDSLGYIDIMRGKYKPDDIKYISQQIRGMTREEQENLVSVPFDVLWENLWGPPAEGSNPYRHEKEISRNKLLAIRTGTPSLADIVKTVSFYWPTPEWGFPKGRREPHESEYICALREMREETGLTETDIIPIKNLDTIKESFYGSNGIQYCHKYFIMYVHSCKDIMCDPKNTHMLQEIGNIKWCSLETALELIRSDNNEKRQALLRVSRLLKNYCPFKFSAI
jgi:8-oxo-dGTP pyrophosphatase MutT (NUDIX family)